MVQSTPGPPARMQTQHTLMLKQPDVDRRSRFLKIVLLQNGLDEPGNGIRMPAKIAVTCMPVHIRSISNSLTNARPSLVHDSAGIPIQFSSIAE